MNSFVTETDIEYVKKQSYKTVGIIFVALSLLALFALLISKRVYACVEVLVILGCLLGIFSKKYDSHNYRFIFEGRDLIVRTKSGSDGFRLPDMSASDFVFKQSKKEMELNYCTLLIKDSTIAFGGVKNCKELKTYINANCKYSH